MFFTANEISTKMPPRLFLQWNNIPELDAISSPSSPHKLHSRTHNGKVEYSSPATVVACVKSPPGGYTWPYILKNNSDQRTAKCVARMRIQETQDLDHIINPKKGKEVGKVRSKRGKNQPQASSPVTQRRKRPRVIDDNDLQWFESINYDRGRRKTRSLSPHSKVALKELSIPLFRIPVRIKKRKMEESDHSASSSRCSTVDSVSEQSSSLLSLPLDNSLAYVNILD